MFGSIVHHHIIEKFVLFAVFDAADVVADENESFSAGHLLEMWNWVGGAVKDSRSLFAHLRVRFALPYT